MCIDGNSENVERAESAIKSSGVPGTAIQHDLGTGTLPEELYPQAVMRFMSSWGISYLDMERLPQLLDACDALVPRCSVDMMMLTEGKFDRSVLTKKFITQVAPWEILNGNFGSLKRAMKALPTMRGFGQELADVVPLWTPEEFGSELGNFGFSPKVLDDTILWGQCSAVRVQKSCLSCWHPVSEHLSE